MHNKRLNLKKFLFFEELNFTDLNPLKELKMEAYEQRP